MLSRLPYRIQIPLGLSLAVVLTALLVTAVAVRANVAAARLDSHARVDRAARLLVAQARPLIAADDTWRVFVLLRDTAGLLPGGDVGRSRAAVLDSDGRAFAASQPARMPIGSPLPQLAGRLARSEAPFDGTAVPLRIEAPIGALLAIEPIRSEDGQPLGFVAIEVDAPVFAADWAALSRPATLGAAMAVALLVPAGWWLGRRMTRPVERVARLIGRIGHHPPARLREELPATRDPELGRINAAVRGWLDGLEARQRAERRALSAERMAAVGRLTAAVAHEVNNPLAGLLTATQTLRVHGAAEATRRRTLDLLQRGLEQVRSTVSALLPQARSDTRPLDPTDLEDVATLARTTAEPLRVEVKSLADFGTAARVPSVMFRQAMLNLMLNAIRAAGAGGAVRAVLMVDTERVQFAIGNTGARLSKADLEQALDAEGGDDPRGFGLWVCRELATEYGGGFALDDDETAATRLVFWVPNRERHEATAADRG